MGESYFGIDGKPCLNKDVIAGWKAEIDERGNQTKVTFLGLDGKPCLLKDGYSTKILVYYEHGNLSEVAHFGLKGEPVLDLKECAHRIVQRYGPNGLAETAYFDCQGRPIPYAEHLAAVAKASSSNGTAGGSQPPMRVRIIAVLAGGEAAIKGVQVGDIVLRYAGVPVTNHPGLIGEIVKPGSESRELVLLRAGKEITLQAPPGPLKVALEEIPMGASPAEKPRAENKAPEKAQVPAPKGIVQKE